MSSKHFQNLHPPFFYLFIFEKNLSCQNDYLTDSKEFATTLRLSMLFVGNEHKRSTWFKKKGL